jgi:hypothetical protein
MINRGCSNHGCVYHYVYPELAKGMHTNGPCHCKARPIADFLYRENKKLKAELEHWTHDSFKRRETSLREALQGILDIGKRDMSNPKYDRYFEAAREAMKEPYEEKETGSI